MSDAEFISRIRAGDHAAFEQLFYEHYVALVAFCTSLMKSQEAAADVVSDVFAALWEQRATWDPRSLRAYLYSSVRNRAFNKLRDTKPTTTWDTTVDEDAAVLASAPVWADAAMVRDEEIQALRSAIDALPPVRRAVMMLRWQQGMSFEEIAAAVGISPNAVHLHLSRGMQWLKKVVPGRIS